MLARGLIVLACFLSLFFLRTASCQKNETDKDSGVGADYEWLIEFDAAEDEGNFRYFCLRQPSDAGASQSAKAKCDFEVEEDESEVRLSLSPRSAVEVVRVRGSRHLGSVNISPPGLGSRHFTLPEASEPVRQCYSFLPVLQPAPSHELPAVTVHLLYAVSQNQCYPRADGSRERAVNCQEGSAYPGFMTLVDFPCSVSQGIPPDQVGLGDVELTNEFPPAESHIGLQTDLCFLRGQSVLQYQQGTCGVRQEVGAAPLLGPQFQPLGIFIHQYAQLNEDGEDEFWTDFYLISGPISLGQISVLEEGEPSEQAELEEKGEQWPDLSHASAPSSEHQDKRDETADEQAGDKAKKKKSKKSKGKKKSGKEESPVEKTVVEEVKEAVEEVLEESEPEEDTSELLSLHNLASMRHYLRLLNLLNRRQLAEYRLWHDAFLAKKTGGFRGEFYMSLIQEILHKLETGREGKFQAGQASTVLDHHDFINFLLSAAEVVGNEAIETLETAVDRLKGKSSEEFRTLEPEVFQEFKAFLQAIFRIRSLAVLVDTHYKGQKERNGINAYFNVQELLSQKLMSGIFKVSGFLLLNNHPPTAVKYQRLMLSVIDGVLVNHIKRRLNEEGGYQPSSVLSLLEVIWPRFKAASVLTVSAPVGQIAVVLATHFKEQQSMA